MATALQTIEGTAPATDPAKLMTQPETWALADSQFSTLPWSAAHAAKSFHPSAVPRLIAAHAVALLPASNDWLQKRLRLLWKSSTPANSLDATAWLHETGRLLADIPQDILADAIDQAVKASDRGFMPTVGQIRAIADPKLQQREMRASRLRAINGLGSARHDEPVHAEPTKKADDGTKETTAEILARVWPTMAQHETGADRDASRPAKVAGGNDKPGRKPTREDYIRMGVDPAALDGMA